MTELTSLPRAFSLIWALKDYNPLGSVIALATLRIHGHIHFERHCAPHQVSPIRAGYPFLPSVFQSLHTTITYKP